MHGCHRLHLDLEGVLKLCLDVLCGLCCFCIVHVMPSRDKGPLHSKNSRNMFPACKSQKERGSYIAEERTQCHPG
jgi:hypothetical protein